MSKKVTTVKTHYPNVINMLLDSAYVALARDGFPEEVRERVDKLLRKAYNMGVRDGREKAEARLQYFVERTGVYAEQIKKLEETMRQLFPEWGWYEEDDGD